MQLIEQLVDAHYSAVPLVGVSTHDPAMLCEALAAQVKDANSIFRWDAASGIVARNQSAKTWVASQAQEWAKATKNPAAALKAAAGMPEFSYVVFMNLHAYWRDPITTQATWNLRDLFASAGSTAIFTSPHFSPPAELRHDVLSFTQDLPGEDALHDVLTSAIIQAKADAYPHLPDFESAELDGITRDLLGMGEFEASQVISLALKAKRIDRDVIKDQSRTMIEAAKGLKLQKSKTTFSDIGGLDELKWIGGQLFRADAPDPIRLIVFVDEFEKAMAGSDSKRGPGDNTGISQGFNMRLLTELEQRDYNGLILYGPPGTGKSLFAESMGNTYGIRTVHFNLKALLQKEVGESEHNLEDALRTIYALAGQSGALWVAAVNSNVNISAEMRRRFSLGIYMVDLPTDAEKAAIWPLNEAKYEVIGDHPDDTNWTGSDIRNCCRQGRRLGCTLKEAAQRIVPTAVSDPDVIADLRDGAHGRYLSAVRQGKYEDPTKDDREPKTGQRKRQPRRAA